MRDTYLLNLKDDYFSEHKVNKSTLEWMISNRHTIVVTDYMASENKYISKIDHDILKIHEFYKVLDAHQVYQKIDQWISGVLTNTEKYTVKFTDDKIKISKHGFDKWSFRKMGNNSLK
jgi:hypothetical protein